MKGDKLGEFEEFTLLGVCALGPDSYAVPIQQFVERATGRNVAMGAIYAALTRLEDKGYLRSMLGEPQQVRGGKRRRHYDATADGKRTVKDLRRVRERIWQAIEEGGRS
jgi:DNA-binding PadR family transcriptional regulator